MGSHLSALHPAYGTDGGNVLPPAFLVSFNEGPASSRIAAQVAIPWNITKRFNEQHLPRSRHFTPECFPILAMLGNVAPPFLSFVFPALAGLGGWAMSFAFVAAWFSHSLNLDLKIIHCKREFLLPSLHFPLKALDEDAGLKHPETNQQQYGHFFWPNAD